MAVNGGVARAGEALRRGELEAYAVKRLRVLHGHHVARQRRRAKGGGFRLRGGRRAEPNAHHAARARGAAGKRRGVQLAKRHQHAVRICNRRSRVQRRGGGGAVQRKTHPANAARQVVGAAVEGKHGEGHPPRRPVHQRGGGVHGARGAHARNHAGAGGGGHGAANRAAQAAQREEAAIRGALRVARVGNAILIQRAGEVRARLHRGQRDREVNSSVASGGQEAGGGVAHLKKEGTGSNRVVHYPVALNHGLLGGVGCRWGARW
jgi:hypothetical protein